MLFKRGKGKGDTRMAENRVGVGQASAETSLAKAPYPSMIQIASVSDLMSASGNPLEGQMVGGWCVLPAHVGGRSVAAIPVSEGDKVRATTHVSLIDGGTSGRPSKFFFGPVFFDADQNVVQWWNAYDRPDQEPSEIVVEATASAGAVTVRLGMHGTWDAKGNTGDYVVGFASARLEKL